MLGPEPSTGLVDLSRRTARKLALVFVALGFAAFGAMLAAPSVVDAQGPPACGVECVMALQCQQSSNHLSCVMGPGTCTQYQC